MAIAKQKKKYEDLEAVLVAGYEKHPSELERHKLNKFVRNELLAHFPNGGQKEFDELIDAGIRERYGKIAGRVHRRIARKSDNTPSGGAGALIPRDNARMPGIDYGNLLAIVFEGKALESFTIVDLDAAIGKLQATNTTNSKNILFLTKVRDKLKRSKKRGKQMVGDVITNDELWKMKRDAKATIGSAV